MVCDKKNLMNDSVQQLLFELMIQRCELEGRTSSPEFQRIAAKFRAKWGTMTLVPPLDAFRKVAAESDGKTAERRKALATLRKEQFAAVKTYYEVLRSLGQSS